MWHLNHLKNNLFVGLLVMVGWPTVSETFIYVLLLDKRTEYFYTAFFHICIG
jgi:hypothetical protein